MAEENSSETYLNNNSNNEYLNIIFGSQIYNYHRVSSLFGEITLINNKFQVFTSLLLCIMGLFGGILHIGIFIQRCFHTKSFSHQIFIQLLFDSCHLFNTLLTHIIVIIVYIKTSTELDLLCPLSTFFFSLASFGSLTLLCLGAINRYMYSFKTRQFQYRYIRHRLLAHRIILITSLSWLIINCPKFDLKKFFES